MPLNLITDAWIPVVDQSGARRKIAPWQMSDPTILRPDWPRPDLNIACLEFLIGLMFMADPPEDLDDWEDRQAQDSDRLRRKLTPFAPGFNLIGDGPLFLQDLEPLGDDPKSPDMLFIDSAGANTARNNADLMVHRDRYSGLDLSLAAMALFTFQAHAPAGGAGNRTSMRGGGPMVTLVDPGSGVWPLIWANVPYGSPASLSDLPWMKPTRISDKGQTVEPPQGWTYDVEAFFGMPRRLRLVATGDLITGVVQKKNGANYGTWMHPLSPYYRVKPGTEALPVHPKAGVFGYRNFLGVLAKARGAELAQRAACLDTWSERGDGVDVDVIVAGWSMDNMKPRDFIHSVYPFMDLTEESSLCLAGLVEAAEKAVLALRRALTPILAEGEAREAEREAFYQATQTEFMALLNRLMVGDDAKDISKNWLKTLHRQVFVQFDRLALPGMDQRDTSDIQAIVAARKSLGLTLAGYGKLGGELFNALLMETPSKPVKKGNAA